MAELEEDQEIIEISEDMQKVIFYAFDEAEKKLGAVDGLVPFTVILSGENLTIEEHSGESAEECRDSARRAIELDPASVDGYVFAYDGYVEPEEGEEDEMDAIILEYAEADMDEALVLCRLYAEAEDGGFAVEEEIAIAGEVDSFIPEDYRIEVDDDDDDDDDDEDEDDD